MAQGKTGSDLLVRTASAIVMMTIAITALWMGGTVFLFFVALIAFLVVLEWRGIIVRFPDSELVKGIWMAVGGVYIAIACAAALLLQPFGLFKLVLAAVIGTDVGAYFLGRFIGGPRIAPSISPSKTWAGLIGGMAGATFGIWLMCRVLAPYVELGLKLSNVSIVMLGALAAIIAQSGDFFESWMKRRAGLKDSGMLIPGHGGMFDRVDGLLPVCIAALILFQVQFGGPGILP